MSDEQEQEVVQEAPKKGEIIKISPKHLGDRAEIMVTRERMLSMIPNAADYPTEVLWATAQLAVAYRLDPFQGEIYISKVGSKKIDNVWVDQYVPIIGIKGFRALARRQGHYVTEPSRRMSQEEVLEFRREDYDDLDIGVEVKLYRIDVANQCKRAGIPYFPTVGRGFYRIKAKAKKDREGNVTSWEADNVPNTWTPYEVAEKRAEKMAIVKAFDLRVPNNVIDDSVDFDAEMQDALRDRERQTAIMHQPEIMQVEEDGDMLYVKSER